MAEDIEAPKQDTTEQAPKVEDADSVLEYQSLVDSESDAEVEAHCFSLFSITKPGE